jgi:hypothetical protein
LNNRNDDDVKLTYITCKSITFINAGIGNQLFVYASIYGIAQSLNRTPLIIANHNQPINDVLRQFTNIDRIFRRINSLSSSSQIKTVAFGEVSAVYDNPNRLTNLSIIKYVKLTGEYFQSWRYFDQFRDNIRRQLFAFDVNDITDAHHMAQLLFNSNDTQHKLCVHIRRGNFLKITKLMRHSTQHFTLYASEFVANRLRSTIRSTPSIVFIGNDDK